MLPVALWATGCSDFFLRARDDEVVDPVVVEEAFVQDGLPALDLLFVLDDTASMAGEQAALNLALSGLGAQLFEAPIEWQVGVLSTDVGADTAGVLLGTPWILTPEVEDPDAILADSLQVGTSGGVPEAGLGAAWLALTEPLQGTLNRGFRRDRAALHIVVASDSDDGSEAVLGGDPSASFLDFLAGEEARTGTPALLSAVVGDIPGGCTGTDGANALPGTTYGEAAEGSGGVVASICALDLEALSDSILTDSPSWPDTFPLQELPVVDTLRVEVDGTRLDSGWTYESEGNLVRISPAPGAESEIRVRYQIASP